MRRDLWIYKVLICVVFFLWGVIGLSWLWAKELSISSLRVREPVAKLIQLNGKATLKRGWSVVNPPTYQIQDPGIGFKVGDELTVSVIPGSYAVILLNKDGSSWVKLGAGATIRFLSATDYAITGVYITNGSTVNSTAEFLFDINHASSTNEFIVWAPDVIVGVRGTVFKVLVSAFDNATATYGTFVIGIEKEVNGSFEWDPNDIWVGVIDYDKLFPSHVLLNPSSIKDFFDKIFIQRTMPLPFVDVGGALLTGVTEDEADNRYFLYKPYIQLKAICKWDNYSPTISVTSQVSSQDISSQKASLLSELMTLLSSIYNWINLFLSTVQQEVQQGIDNFQQMIDSNNSSMGLMQILSINNNDND